MKQRIDSTYKGNFIESPRVDHPGLFVFIVALIGWSYRRLFESRYAGIFWASVAVGELIMVVVR